MCSSYDLVSFEDEFVLESVRVKPVHTKVLSRSQDEISCYEKEIVIALHEASGLYVKVTRLWVDEIFNINPKDARWYSSLESAMAS